MKLKQKKIQGIPVICWGEPSEKIILAFHGDQSHKEDPVIQFLADVNKILLELEKQAARIALFGCSIGAYFSMLTCQNRSIEQSLFLSPIVDMQKLIENIMRWSDLTPTDLRQKKIIETPIKTLEWEYYSYVVDHPITWTAPTAILYGGQDMLTERGTIETFAAAPQISLTIFEAGEHFFHTPDQLQVYQQWLEKKLK